MSMSGNLMPSIPYQILLKYTPPKITMIYYLENNDKEKFYHDIFVEKRMLENMSEDEIVTHLYISEDYYFNPKHIKRQQVMKLVQKLKEGLKNPPKNKKATNQNNINQNKLLQQHQQAHSNQKQLQSNLPQLSNHNTSNDSGNNSQQSPQNIMGGGNRKNFLQRRGIPNYDPNAVEDHSNDVNSNANAANGTGQQTTNINSDRGSPPNVNAINNKRFTNHKRFDDEPVIKNRAPSHSPQSELRKPVTQKLAPLELPKVNAPPKYQNQIGNPGDIIQIQHQKAKQEHIQQIPDSDQIDDFNPLTNQNLSGSNLHNQQNQQQYGQQEQYPHIHRNKNQANRNNSPSPSRQQLTNNSPSPLQNQIYANDQQQILNNSSNYQQQQQQYYGNQQQQQSANSGNKSFNNNGGQMLHDDLVDIIQFDESDQENDGQQQNPQIFHNQYDNNSIQHFQSPDNDQNLMGGQSSQQQIDDFNLGNDTSLTQYNDGQPQTLLDEHDQQQFMQGGGDLNDDQEEEESVYIKDNIVMRRIQIEGEDVQYLMDPDGNIYNMQGDFIGTANTNQLEDNDDGDNTNLEDNPNF
eukprot:403356615